MYVVSFKDLIVWQRAIESIVEIYKATASLPDTERYGLTSQLRRAAVSIPANIAEGKRRKTRNDFLHFLRIADGSAAEVETYLILITKLYPKVDISRCGELLVEVQKMLITMIRRLEANVSKS